MPQSEEEIQKQYRYEVDTALDHFVAGLKPFVVRELEQEHGSDWEAKASHMPGRKLNLNDPSALLGTMLYQWRDVFQDSLENTGRNLVGEVKGWRNFPAHRDPLSAEDVIRSLDSMIRLLELVAPLCQTENIASSLQKLKSRKLELEIQRIGHLISPPIAPTEPTVTESHKAAEADETIIEATKSDDAGDEKHSLDQKAQNVLFGDSPTDVNKTKQPPLPSGDLRVERVKKPNSTMWLLQIYDGNKFIGSYERSTTELGAKEKEVEILWPNNHWC